MFESSQGSQAFLEPKIEPLKGEKSPLLAGFCNFAPVSELSNWRTRRPFREKCYYREYSRFRETFTGDAVRSPLRAGAGEST